MKSIKRKFNIVFGSLAHLLNHSSIALQHDIMGKSSTLCHPETRVLPKINKLSLFRILPVQMHSQNVIANGCEAIQESFGLVRRFTPHNDIMGKHSIPCHPEFISGSLKHEMLKQVQHDIIKNNNINKPNMEVLNDYC